MDNMDYDPCWKEKKEIERLKLENSALLDAIGSLKDFVEGKRNDFKNISEILNGAMKIGEKK